MEIILVILSILIIILFYKVGVLNKHLSVFSFSEKNINRLLVKKEIIKPSEIYIIINESIGDMHEDIGNKIIKNAKSIGIDIPKYMDKDELKKYIEKQELKRRSEQVSFTDKMLMNDSDL